MGAMPIDPCTKKDLNFNGFPNGMKALAAESSHLDRRQHALSLQPPIR
jgi:hypothetical protein